MRPFLFALLISLGLIADARALSFAGGDRSDDQIVVAACTSKMAAGELYWTIERFGSSIAQTIYRQLNCRMFRTSIYPALQVRCRQASYDCGGIPMFISGEVWYVVIWPAE